MVQVEINNLWKRFPDGTTIGPINLTIDDGEMVTLLGPSGSGKTTTLRMVAGFITPDSGALSFDGRNVIDVAPRERKIGMVVQSTALFPNMNVYQNISFALDVAGWKQDATIQRVENLSEMLGIKNLLNRRIDEISGGESQRVAVARALAIEPELLLLDEPFSALDPKLRLYLQQEIRNLQKEMEISTLYVTHNQSEAFAISDRIAVLNEGIIVQTGIPDELYSNPSDDFVATFIGGGSILRGLVVDHKKGVLKIDLGNTVISVEGESTIGNNIALSVKPEDIAITDESNGIPCVVITKTAQVGYHRVELDIDGQIITSEISPNDSLKIGVGDKVFIEINQVGVDIINQE
ncbi:MAG: ABC transporter ATP-binding protein [Candidatus Thorarchaeota archaeon]